MYLSAHWREWETISGLEIKSETRVLSRLVIFAKAPWVTWRNYNAPRSRKTGPGQVCNLGKLGPRKAGCVVSPCIPWCLMMGPTPWALLSLIKWLLGKRRETSEGSFEKSNPVQASPLSAGGHWHTWASCSQPPLSWLGSATPDWPVFLLYHLSNPVNTTLNWPHWLYTWMSINRESSKAQL